MLDVVTGEAGPAVSLTRLPCVAKVELGVPASGGDRITYLVL